MDARGNITGVPSGLYGPGGLTGTDTGLHPHWARITGQAAGTNRYSHEQIDDGDHPTFAAELAESFGTVGTTAVEGYPAYELNGRQDVPTGAIVRVWPAGDLTYVVFSYEKTAATSSQWKEPVRCATTATGTLASSFENGDTVDGVTLATGDRILLMHQGPDNGIYTVNASGAPTRATDMDAGSEFPGAVVAVLEGTLNKDTIWKCTNNTAPTLGVTTVTWSIVSAKLYSIGFNISVTADNTWTASGATLTLPPGSYLVGIQSQIDGILYDSTTPGPLIVDGVGIQAGYGIGAAPTGNALRTVHTQNIAGANNTDQKGQIRRTFTVVWGLNINTTTTIEVYGLRGTPTSPAAWTTVAFGNAASPSSIPGTFWATPYTIN